MEPVNRFALIVRPKRRYKGWADSVAESDDAVFDLDEARGTPAVYLVAVPAEVGLQDIIDDYSADIFEEQLMVWHKDERAWPVNRSPHVFRDWFDVTLADTVIDLDPEEPTDVDDELLEADERETDSIERR